MAELLEDLDTIARLESSSFEMRLEPHSITSMIRDSLESVEAKAQQNGISLSHSIESAIEDEPMVLCGGSQVRQVLVNLMGNSIHYGKPEGSTHVTLSIKDPFVEVVIEDDGIGISEEDQARIYERFYRVDRSRSRNSGGSGLGLAIVKHILEAHGQEIQVTSKIGEGTRFSFQLQRIPAGAIG